MMMPHRVRPGGSPPIGIDEAEPGGMKMCNAASSFLSFRRRGTRSGPSRSMAVFTRNAPLLGPAPARRRWSNATQAGPLDLRGGHHGDRPDPFNIPQSHGQL